MEIKYTSKDYNLYIKGLVIDQKTQKQVNETYKQQNKNDTLSKLASRFIDIVKSKKIDNKTIETTFNYFTSVLVVSESDRQKINALDKFVLKSKLVEIYNKCQTNGTIKTIIDNQIIYNYGMKHKTPLACLKDMYKTLLAEKKIFNKPPKKEKAKKSIKK